MRRDGSQEVTCREGQVWAAPVLVLVLKLGSEMLPAGWGAVCSGLESLLKPACGDGQRLEIPGM